MMFNCKNNFVATHTSKPILRDQVELLFANNVWEYILGATQNLFDFEEMNQKLEKSMQAEYYKLYSMMGFSSYEGKIRMTTNSKLLE